MKRVISWLIFIGLVQEATAQVADQFTDGDFTSNPAWNGDVSSFEVNAVQQLHLNAPAVADTAILFTEHSLVENAEWKFFFTLDFSPSASNLLKVYLCADQPDFRQPLNGYFLRMGEDGSADDIDLYRQEGTLETLIIDGVDGTVSAATNSVSVKVTRDGTGNWALFTDVSGGTNYVLEGTGNDVTFTTTSYFGFFCKYTSTRSDKFYFDDVFAGIPVVDLEPPHLDSLSVVGPLQLDLWFTEVLLADSAEDESNYSVNNGIGFPAAAQLDAGNPSLVHLTFPLNFPTGSHTLAVSGLADLKGNTMTPESLGFSFYQPAIKDVIFTEIMADPEPVVGLPSVEYVELFNRSAFTLQLQNWMFSDASASVSLDPHELPSGGWVILCHPDDVSALSAFGPVLPVNSFPSLNNDGDALQLMDASGSQMDAVEYDLNWYGDAIKSEGGWSLEKMDTGISCDQASAWHASVAPAGGTPGQANSDLSNFADTTAPVVTSVSLTDPSTIAIQFSEAVLAENLMDPLNYSLDPPGTAIVGLLAQADQTGTTLTVWPPLDSGVIYKLTITGMSDCAGNIAAISDTISIAIPQQPVPGDLVINEILFNPSSNGFDYVELYNVSGKTFDLKDFSLAKTDDLDSLDQETSLTDASRYFFPGDYLVFTEDAGWVQLNYQVLNAQWLIEVDELPSLNDDEGTIVLVALSGGRIDQVRYSEDWHFALIDETEGISLERIDPLRPSQDSTNWHSASSTVGYGTPTAKNSQYYQAGFENEILLDPQVFSPDNDGYKDVLNISYQFDQPGFVANITIYDAEGRQVAAVARNVLLDQKGTITWDGINESGQKARMGTHIVWMEVYDLDGNVKHFRKVCVVAARKS